MATKKKPSLPPLKDHVIKFRASDKERNRIRFLAEQYAGGNSSMWLVYAALNAPRRFLVSPRK
jgi:hypothetical protein